jgi:hypothetical protein
MRDLGLAFGAQDEMSDEQLEEVASTHAYLCAKAEERQRVALGKARAESKRGGSGGVGKNQRVETVSPHAYMAMNRAKSREIKVSKPHG